MSLLAKTTINWDARTVRIRQGKTGNYKVIGPLGTTSVEILREFYNASKTDLVFSRSGNISPKFYRILREACERAGPTIRTTNDMPIVEPPSFDALGLVTFQINPHYLDADANSKHMGETREQRIIQFLEENETPVVGLREGAMLRIEDGKILLKGSTGARIFRREHEPVETLPGGYLDEFLS